MGPIKHLIYSTGVATMLMVHSKRKEVALACAATGVLVDLDHIIEYQDFCHGKWDWEEFATGTYFDKKGTVKVIFHSWELAIILWGVIIGNKKITKGSLLYGIAVGYTLHLILDQIGNNLNPKGYFEIYRWLVDWKQDKLIR